MSAPSSLAAPHLGVTRSLDRLAPRFRTAVQLALAECNGALGLNAFVYESYRSDALQTLYYQRGRTIKPPHTPVTNAPTSLYSWHGYGLAVDVINAERRWDVPRSWYESVAVVFSRFGCRWGGSWKVPDVPHFQWCLCKPSPSDRARELVRQGGLRAVWRAVGADAPHAVRHLALRRTPRATTPSPVRRATLRLIDPTNR